MEHKDFYADIKYLHKDIVAETVALMVEHGVTEVDLLGSDCDHAYVVGYPGDGADVMEMEVSKVYYRDCQLWLDVILDIDTEELAGQNENGDIGDAYQCWRANDFEHFKPCGGIEMVYESVWQVLEHRLPRVTEPEEMEFYSIEPDGKGGKQIHVLGYCYTEGDDQGDGPWRNVEYTGFIEPLQEFIDHLKQNENYVDETAADVKQYIGDYTDEGMTDVINHYFDGHTANRRLHYSEITIDTPCGDYIA